MPKYRQERAGSINTKQAGGVDAYANRVQKVRELLNIEYNPRTLTEAAIVADMARRITHLKMLDETIEVLQFQITRGLSDVTRPIAVPDDEKCNASPLAAFVGGRVDECLRHSLGTARALHRCVDILSRLQADRRQAAATDRDLPDERFRTELDCLAHLVRRFRSGQQPCRRCQSRGAGSWIASRRCWECAQCRAQTGIRAGTVMSRSAVFWN